MLGREETRAAMPLRGVSLIVVATMMLASCGGGSAPGTSPTPQPNTVPTPVPAPVPVPAPQPAPVPIPTPPPVITTAPPPVNPPATTPPATPPPATTPTPPGNLPIPPAPAVGTNYNSAEYQASNGVLNAKALTAYTNGATGRGVMIGIIDSGIDLNSPEFNAPNFGTRISELSRDVVSGRSLQDENGHGTYVAAVAAAAKNDSGVHGVAFNSALLIARTDNACPSPTTGCSHDDNDIAAGVELATSAGVRVMNISLGGSPPNLRLTRAVNAATAAGIVVVFSAGNEFDSDNIVERAAAVNPDSFPRTLMQATAAANGLILAVGAIDPDTNVITDFSNRAGDQSQFYIAAPGIDILTRGLNGNLVSVSGTSFASPHVAGALALLLEAFPNLTGKQAVDLLLRSARDAGAPGTDSVYGRGILDINRAFQPQGGLAVASTTGQSGTAVSLEAPLLKVGSAFGGGDTLRAALGGVIVQDIYDRAFTVNFGAQVQAVTTNINLAAKLRSRYDSVRSSVSAAGRTQLSFNADGARRYIYEEGKPAAARLTPETSDVRVLGQMQLSNTLALGFAQGYGVDMLAQAPISANNALFLATPDTLVRRPGAAASMRWQSGRTTWRIAAGSAKALGYDPQRRQEAEIFSAVIAADRQFGPLAFTTALTFEQEQGSVLGSVSQNGLGLGRGSRSVRPSLGLSFDAGDGWHVSGAAEMGSSRVDGAGNALVQSVRGLITSQWHVAVQKNNLFGRGLFALHVNQPLRVEGGSALLDVPTAFSYAAMRASNSLRSLSLAPDARELDVELGYRLGTGGLGDVQLNLFHRLNPGHQSRGADDSGAALQWQLRF
jgi:subtilisin family serine protease